MGPPESNYSVPARPEYSIVSNTQENDPDTTL